MKYKVGDKVFFKFGFSVYEGVVKCVGETQYVIFSYNFEEFLDREEQHIIGGFTPKPSLLSRVIGYLFGKDTQ